MGYKEVQEIIKAKLAASANGVNSADGRGLVASAVPNADASEPSHIVGRNGRLLSSIDH
jgi:hypothetical protein